MLYCYSSCITVESGLIGRASHPDVQKIRITGFFLENRLQLAVWSWKKISTNGCFGLHFYLLTNETLIHNSLYVFDIWRKNVSYKKDVYNYSQKMFTVRAKPIRTTSFQINGFRLILKSILHGCTDSGRQVAPRVSGKSCHTYATRKTQTPHFCLQ
jgi:hypothetical protein